MQRLLMKQAAGRYLPPLACLSACIPFSLPASHSSILPPLHLPPDNFPANPFPPRAFHSSEISTNATYDHALAERVAETRKKLKAKEEMAKQSKLQVWQKRDARLRKFLEQQVPCTRDLGLGGRGCMCASDHSQADLRPHLQHRARACRRATATALPPSRVHGSGGGSSGRGEMPSQGPFMSW